MDNFSVTLITPNLLQDNPQQYLGYLNYCINNKIDVKEQINKKLYHTWYSNHLLCLSYLVGELKDSSISSSESNNYYGFNRFISENLGIDILTALVVLGVDINSKNYYGDDIFASISRENVLSERINNKRFN